AGSLYEHSKPAGTVPAATWDVASTCLITGATTATPGGLGQNFGDFIWDCEDQAATFATGNMTISGNYTLVSTGSGILSVAAGSSNVNFNIGGDFNVQGGEMRIKTGGNGNAGVSTVGGNLNITDGTLDLC